MELTPRGSIVFQTRQTSHTNGGNLSTRANSNRRFADRQFCGNQSKNDFNKKSKEVEELVYLISHNLKTPLVSVEGYTSLLLEEDQNQLTTEQLHYIKRIRKNVHTMNHIINSLLDFARFGKMEQVFEAVELGSTLEQLLSDYITKNFRDAIRFKIAKPLPVVYGNKEGLQTVFENLISNAVKYRRPTKDAFLEISHTEQPRFLAFHIRDNGIGIDQQAQKRVFKLFQRGTNVGEIEGSGVGLAICEKIIRKHGGHISLHSQLGRGTTVSFTLPKFQNQ